jgi:hypothetical protein
MLTNADRVAWLHVLPAHDDLLALAAWFRRSAARLQASLAIQL